MVRAHQLKASSRWTSSSYRHLDDLHASLECSISAWVMRNKWETRLQYVHAIPTRYTHTKYTPYCRQWSQPLDWVWIFMRQTDHACIARCMHADTVQMSHAATMAMKIMWKFMSLCVTHFPLINWSIEGNSFKCLHVNSKGKQKQNVRVIPFQR